MWVQLLITALLVALLPLSLVWVSDDADKYRKLIGVTLFLTLDLIIFGAFTRLTDSGLGCPDWPGCYGQANPWQSLSAIQSAQAEMIHRYLAMCVGVLIVAKMIISWWRRRKFKHSPWLATGLFFFVCLQGAFGAWTVTLKLQPVIVTIHLLLGMGLLALLTWAWVREGANTLTQYAKQNLTGIATFALVLLFLQIALGGWVSTNYAALACHDYPLCNVAIQWVHRSFAWLVVLVILYLAYQVKKIGVASNLAKALFILIFLQLLSGASTVFFSWPLLIAVIHNAGAALLVLLLCMLNYRVRHAATP
ncbi:MAG: COX15/CtaA family protein [Burkholderiales bacterium]|nr:COX15/CtaA family protein [Burkholderiales bacterium]